MILKRLLNSTLSLLPLPLFQPLRSLLLADVFLTYSLKSPGDQDFSTVPVLLWPYHYSVFPSVSVSPLPQFKTIPSSFFSHQLGK